MWYLSNGDVLSPHFAYSSNNGKCKKKIESSHRFNAAEYFYILKNSLYLIIRIVLFLKRKLLYFSKIKRMEE